jgi:hypothetical protein
MSRELPAPFLQADVITDDTTVSGTTLSGNVFESSIVPAGDGRQMRAISVPQYGPGRLKGTAPPMMSFDVFLRDPSEKDDVLFEGRNELTRPSPIC